MPIPSKLSDKKSDGLLDASRSSKRLDLSVVRSELKSDQSDSSSSSSVFEASEDEVFTEIMCMSKMHIQGDNFDYLRRIEAIEKLKILDVTHVVTRALEEDPAGLWSNLKKTVEDDVRSAIKFIEDLNTFLSSTEGLKQSLDPLESQKKFDSKFRDFLLDKIDENLSPASSRPTLLNQILSYPIDDLSNTKIMLILINEIRSRVSDFNSGYSKAANELVNTIGQRDPYDPNSESRFPWNAIRSVSDENNISQLLLCSYALSNVFNLSSGIARLKKIQPEIGLNVTSISDLDQIFEGVKASIKIKDVAVPTRDGSSSNLRTDVSIGNILYRKNIDAANYALKILRYDQTDGSVVIPCESEPNVSYSSGEKALVRNAIANGDLQFSELDLYSRQLNKSISDLQKITESAVGLLNSENDLSPVAVFRRMLEYFTDALALADQSEINKYQLIALQSAYSGSDSTKQYILRCLGAIKYNRLKSNVRSGSSQESSSSTTSITTTRTSENSEVIKDDATVKTVESTTTSRSGNQLSISNRTIARAASDNSGIDDQAQSFALQIFEDKATNDLSDARARDAAAGAIAFVQVYRESWDKEGTIFSLMVDLYEDLISKSKNSIPEGFTIVGSDGYTSYGKMDEYAILSLIVSCFLFISRKFITNLTFSFKDDGSTKFSFGGAALSSASSRLRSIISSVGDVSSDDDVSLDFNSIKKDVETYQNVYAFLEAYSKVIKESKDLAVLNFTQVANDVNFAADRNRLKTLSEITPHGIAVRRALLRKWEPIASAGYLPRIFSDVPPIDWNFSHLSSETVPNTYRDYSLKNIRILHVGIPRSTVINSMTGRSNFLKVKIIKNDYRFNIDSAFDEKEYVFDPALFVNSLGSSAASQESSYVLFDKNGFIGPYSYQRLFTKYFDENPGMDPEIIKQIMRNAYNSAIFESQNYYTAGFVLDESTSMDGDASISSNGLNALTSLADLRLPDVSLPSGSSISRIFQDGYINFNEVESGISDSKKEMLANIASSYLLRNSKLLDRLTRAFDHDRVFLIPIDPDSFIARIPAFSGFGLTLSYDFERAPNDEGGQILLNQDPNNRGMSTCSFAASIAEYLISTSESESTTQGSSSGTSRNSLDVNIFGTEDPSRRFNPTIDPRGLSIDREVNVRDLDSQLSQFNNLLVPDVNKIVNEIQMNQIENIVNENLIDSVVSDAQSVVANVARNITRVVSRGVAANAASSAARNFNPNRWRGR